MVIWKGAFFLSQRTSKTTYYRNFWGLCVCGGVHWDLWGQPFFGWPLWSSCWSRDFFPYTDWSLIHASRAWDEFSGQSLATSHDLGPQNAAKWRDISLVHGNLGWWLIWPEFLKQRSHDPKNNSWEPLKKTRGSIVKKGSSSSGKLGGLHNSWVREVESTRLQLEVSRFTVTLPETNSVHGKITYHREATTFIF